MNELLSRVDNVILEGENMYETVKSSAIFAEQLSSVDLPLKVTGTMLSEGRPKLKYYSAEQLKKAVQNPLNQSFPIRLDHRDGEVASIVGRVDRIWYDERLKEILYDGHINSELYARNILDKLITDVSATIASNTGVDAKLGIVGTNLIFTELSLIEDGADPKNTLKVV